MDPQPRRPRADRARQIADALRRQVLDGDFTDGVLPDERLLGREYGATRNAVREALERLRADGLIERSPGIGTVVVARKYPHGLNQLMGLAETLHDHGVVTNEVRTSGLVAATGVLADRLGLDAGSEIVCVERLRRLNGLPLSLDLTYLPADVGEPLLAEDLVNNDVFTLLERICGQPLGRAEIGMEAVNADPHVAAVLDLPRGGALLLVERLTRLADGRPVDLEFIRFRGDRLTMRAVLDR